VEFRALLAPAQQAMIREANIDDINPRRQQIAPADDNVQHSTSIMRR